MDKISSGEIFLRVNLEDVNEERLWLTGHIRGRANGNLNGLGAIKNSLDLYKTRYSGGGLLKRMNLVPPRRKLHHEVPTGLVHSSGGVAGQFGVVADLSKAGFALFPKMLISMCRVAVSCHGALAIPELEPSRATTGLLLKD